MVYERSKQTRWLPGLYSLLLYDFVKSVVIVFYNIMRERIYEGAVSGLLFQLEAEDLIQKLPVSMQPYGADNGAYIALHTANGRMIFRGYFHVESFGDVDKQLRIGNSADDTIYCVAEPHVGVVDFEAPEQVAGFSFVFHDDSSRYRLTPVKLNRGWEGGGGYRVGQDDKKR